MVAGDQDNESTLVTALWKYGYVAKPRLTPFVAIHTLWAFTLLGIAVAAAWMWPTNRPVRPISYVLSAAGLVALGVLILREIQISHSSIWLGRQAFLGPHILHALALNTRLPVVQVMLAGIVFGLVARRRKTGTSPTEAKAPVEVPIDGAATSRGNQHSGDLNSAQS